MLLLKLLIAHFLGDFAFQKDSWVKQKEKYKIASKYLYFHIGVHALLLVVVLGFQKKYIGLLSLILVSHYIIDLIKLYIPTKNKIGLFFVDQVLHLSVIIGSVIVLKNIKFEVDNWFTAGNLLFLLAIILVTVVSSIVLKVLFAIWSKEIEKISKSDSSLSNAGKYIGMLERLLVFVFVILNHWEAIGFLLAAKSVFRFSDLTNSKDRKLTEYILIGTLLSFGIAILIGLVYLKLISKI